MSVLVVAALREAAAGCTGLPAAHLAEVASAWPMMGDGWREEIRRGIARCAGLHKGATQAAYRVALSAVERGRFGAEV